MNLETLRILVAKGLSSDDILEVAESMKVRSSNAERQARYRERQRNGDNVTRNATANPDKEKSPTPPKEINPSPPVISSEITPPPIANDDLTEGEVLEAWNGLASDCGLPTVSKLTNARRRKLHARIRDHPFEDWAAALAAIRRSQFLRGENDRGWRANFDWLLRPETIPKLLEGQYDEQTAAR